MNIVQCYSPTTTSDEGSKGEFYSRLHSIIHNYSRRDITLVIVSKS